MMNVFLGFEQANRYRLVNAQGEEVGFLAEQEGGFGQSIGRQVMRGHRRRFALVIFDNLSASDNDLITSKLSLVS